MDSTAGWVQLAAEKHRDCETKTIIGGAPLIWWNPHSLLSLGTYYTSHYTTDWPDFSWAAYTVASACLHNTNPDRALMKTKFKDAVLTFECFWSLWKCSVFLNETVTESSFSTAADGSFCEKFHYVHCFYHDIVKAPLNCLWFIEKIFSKTLWTTACSIFTLVIIFHHLMLAQSFCIALNVIIIDIKRSLKIQTPDENTQRLNPHAFLITFPFLFSAFLSTLIIYYDLLKIKPNSCIAMFTWHLFHDPLLWALPLSSPVRHYHSLWWLFST